MRLGKRGEREISIDCSVYAYSQSPASIPEAFKTSALPCFFSDLRSGQMWRLSLNAKVKAVIGFLVVALILFISGCKSESVQTTFDNVQSNLDSGEAKSGITTFTEFYAEGKKIEAKPSPGKYDVKLTGMAVASVKEVEIEGLDFKGNVDFKVEPLEEKEEAAKTFIVKSTETYEKATIKKVAEGDELRKCRQWDFERKECVGGWEKISDLKKGDEYALDFENGVYAEIVVLNPVTYLRDGETWAVEMVTFGTADFSFDSPNSNWEEIAIDKTETFDEMRFIDLKCGSDSVKKKLVLIDEEGKEWDYSELNAASIRPAKFIVKNYNCPYKTYLSNHMNKAGYAIINFTFGDSADYAIDPTSVVVSTGIAETETQYGGQQRKIVFAGGNWYAFYNDGTDVLYKKSSDGITWGSAVDLDSVDADNYNPTAYFNGTSIYVAWVDDGADAIEVKDIDVQGGSDTLGTLCTSASLGSINGSYIVSMTSPQDDSVMLAYSDISTDTEANVLKLTYNGCAFNSTGNRTITLSNYNSSNNTNTMSLNFSVKINPGDDRILVAHIGERRVTIGSHNQISTVKYGTQSLTFGIRGYDGDTGAEIWYLVDPPIGTNTINITTVQGGSDVTAISAGVSVWNGVAQTGTIVNLSNNSVTVNIATISTRLTSSPEEMVVDVVAKPSDFDDTWTADTDQTKFFDQWTSAGGDLLASGSYKRGNFTFNMTWTSNKAEALTIAAASIKPAALVPPASRPVLVSAGNNTFMIYQNGTLRSSVYNGTEWTNTSVQIANITDNVYSATTNGTDVWVLTKSSTTGTNLFRCTQCSNRTQTWTNITTLPWTAETNITSVSLTYEHGTNRLIAYATKGTSVKGAFKYSNAASFSWSKEYYLGFTEGSLSDISSPINSSATFDGAAVARQGANFEFSNITIPAIKFASPTPNDNDTVPLSRNYSYIRFRVSLKHLLPLQPLGCHVPLDNICELNRVNICRNDSPGLPLAFYNPFHECLKGLNLYKPFVRGAPN